MRWLTTENLRKAALVLTALLVAQVLLVGAKLVFKSPPDPVVPAASSLNPAWLEFPGTSMAESELVERPLYWKGRSKQAAQQSRQTKRPAGAQKADEFDRVSLLGVFTGGDPAGVIVKFKAKRQRISIGDTVAGWTLALLSADGAIFEKGPESRQLDLEHVYPRNAVKPGVSRKAPAKVVSAEKQQPDSKTGQAKPGNQAQ